ncbi:hypothetical protein KBD81_00620, partial [Candidatus Woesebacteria bacterium]|nr:hypothetical protein [Candidatus Woesebacteria bacterium]
MSHIYPGKIVKNAQLKDGRDVLLRHPTQEDAAEMLEFINTLSKEDTFITFSGEQLTFAEESAYLSSVIKGMEDENSIHVLAFVDHKLAGSATINRDLKGRKRSYHQGIFGITIAREFRALGLGEIVARTTMDEALVAIPGLRMFHLSV